MTTSALQATQLDPRSEPLPDALASYDYADTFEIHLAEPDDRSAEEWVRCALENAPMATRLTISNAWRHALRFDVGPDTSPSHLLGANIVESRPELIHLELRGPLLRGVILGRRPDSHNVSLTTLLFYEQSLRAQAAWAVIGPAHRRIVPQLLEQAAAKFGR